jgi:hypothetical protein
MRIFSDGNVGINTGATNAGFKLDVNGTARVSGQVSGNSFVPTASTIPTNGMYLPSANTVSFSTNTTERLRITSDGAIGFNGTSAIGNAGLDKMSMGYLNSNYGWIQTWASTNLVLNGSGNNVGIGITAPTSRLDIGNGTLTLPTLRGRTYTLNNVSSENPNFINGTGFNSIPVRVGDIIDLPFSQTRTVTAVTDTQLTVDSAWTTSFAGVNVEGRGAIVFQTNNADRLTIAGTGAATFSSTVTATNGLFVSGTNQNTIGSGSLSLINFSAYNSSANQSITLGLALDTAVNNNIAYNYLFNVGGNADGQNLTLSSRRRGIADLTILTVNGNNGAATFSSSVTATSFIVNTSGQARTISTFHPSGSAGENIWIGGGGTNSTTGGGASGLGSNNTSLGVFALEDNTTGARNTAIGYLALSENTSGNSNTASGEFSMYKNTTGYINSAYGSTSLAENTTGYGNAAFGMSSLRYITTGDRNTAIGLGSGEYVNSGAENNTSRFSTYLGYDTRASANGNTNEVVIGSEARGQGSNSVVIGNGSITKTILRGDVLIGTETTVTGAMLNVNGNIRTAAPTGTAAENWRLGRALLATSSVAEDTWIRVQLGTKIYDILAIDRGNA